ncbi:TOP3B [Symbiodinium sp. CCMP2456]|nr:TOP3B [Symbiodinium sp. CCMP2456]
MVRFADAYIGRSKYAVLMVAEKPSIAAALTEALCPQRSGASKRRATSPSSPVHEYSGTFLRQPARFRVTATTGHVYSLDFSQEYNNWETHSPDSLFSATTVRTYDGRANMPAHIAAEAKDCDILVLWLDCDREGENICFEVLELALPHMRPAPVGAFPDAYRGCVYRARFSSLAPQDLQAAMMQLAQPNRDEALSVDARQELDLRVGVAFSRLQTMYFRKHFGRQLGKQMVTYGPCQIPTLWFCVHRHVAIVDFVPEPYWQLTATVSAGQRSFQAQCDQGRIWNETEAQALLGSVEATTGSRSPTSLRCWSHAQRKGPVCLGDPGR